MRSAPHLCTAVRDSGSFCSWSSCLGVFDVPWLIHPHHFAVLGLTTISPLFANWGARSSVLFFPSCFWDASTTAPSDFPFGCVCSVTCLNCCFSVAAAEKSENLTWLSWTSSPPGGHNSRELCCLLSSLSHSCVPMCTRDGT